MAELKMPHNIGTKIVVTNHNGYFRAVFDWNNGELVSDEDFEIPMSGEGMTAKEAIGDLITVYNEMHK